MLAPRTCKHTGQSAQQATHPMRSTSRQRRARRSAAAAAMAWIAMVHADHPASDIIQLPVYVDEHGDMQYFMYNPLFNLYSEARKFCEVHRSMSTENECVADIANQVSILRNEQLQGLQELQPFAFTVRDASGQDIQFIHREGKLLNDEAKYFCLDHFAQFSQRECVQAMINSAKKALDELYRQQREYDANRGQTSPAEMSSEMYVGTKHGPYVYKEYSWG